MKTEINDIRIIPKGTPFWSISNQEMITMSNDLIIQVTATCCGSDYVFAKPMQLIFNLAGYIPTLIGKGTDEIGISLSNTIEYEVPKPTFLTMTLSTTEPVVNKAWDMKSIHQWLVDVDVLLDVKNVQGESEGRKQLIYIIRSLEKLINEKQVK